MKRSKKNIDGRIRQIVSLALRVNRETNHHVFVRYSGHTQGIEVYFYQDGWKSDKDMSFNRYFYIDHQRDLFANLSECRAKLKSLLPKNK